MCIYIWKSTYLMVEFICTMNKCTNLQTDGVVQAYAKLMAMVDFYAYALYYVNEMVS